MNKRSAKVRRVNLPKDRRIIAISDIHGNLGHLQALLAKCNFNKNDILVIVGDMLEKGADSLSTLRYIMELSRTHTVYTVMGNCDEWNRSIQLTISGERDYLRFYLNEDKYGRVGLLSQMCRELGISISIDMDIIQMTEMLSEHFYEEFAFLDDTPHVLDCEKLLFVHGGPLEGTPETWDAWRCMKNDRFLDRNRSFDNWVIVGHWPVVLYGSDRVCANPVIERERKIASIDGGCALKDDGQLNALIIPHIDSDNFSFLSYDELPKARVLSTQEGSEQSAYFRFGDNIVEVLKSGEEFSYCRHVRTRYEMYILTKYLRQTRKGLTICNDCTDYVLPLQAGATVSVMERTSRGYFVKHEGTSGWYFGEIEDIDEN